MRWVSCELYHGKRSSCMRFRKLWWYPHRFGGLQPTSQQVARRTSSGLSCFECIMHADVFGGSQYPTPQSLLALCCLHPPCSESVRHAVKSPSARNFLVQGTSCFIVVTSKPSRPTSLPGAGPGGGYTSGSIKSPRKCSKGRHL
jgi:hypothetical protein